MQIEQLLPYIKSVAIELSNQCNMRHAKCPLSVEQPTAILKTSIVLNVLRLLAEWDYEGSISFHRYNEPFVDPRLYFFLEHTDLRVKLCTNGQTLDGGVLRDLDNLGVELMHVSAYTEKRREEVQGIYDALPGMQMTLHAQYHKGFKPLLGIYDRDEILCEKPCGAPLGEIVINCHGQVTLCCSDWQNRHTFGSLYSLSLPVILTSQAFVDTWQRLSQGDRFLDICKRCASQRGIG
jgi:hypothetical protein